MYDGLLYGLAPKTGKEPSPLTTLSSFMSSTQLEVVWAGIIIPVLHMGNLKFETLTFSRSNSGNGSRVPGTEVLLTQKLGVLSIAPQYRLI